ncbi:tRNA (adenosine(37)-N6)-dimethylallyltransferase MiaA [Alphaproteobacteria bacterium]|nr:tRNA (adenosine(37)-N6)-dimethylallyltransferase MiaA [Alphaproteobacteria bacterium]
MSNKLDTFIHFISGPTAVGKSQLAIKLAKKINGEIINGDSMQVYSNLHILTARPSKEDEDFISHKLYGYVDGSIRYNVASWCKDTLSLIKENKKNNKNSIIVGGTGMYIDTLINGLIDIPKIPEEYKTLSQNLLNDIGTNKFIEEIKKFDPQALIFISVNDLVRLRRIWEVYKFTGTSFSEWKIKPNRKFIQDENFNIFLILPDRQKIYNNVNERFHKMFKNGAIEEVQKLLSLNLDTTLPIMRAHGVPEITNFLNNLSTMEETINRGQQVTRNYVKRQLTWWRSSKLRINHVFNEFPNKIDENMIKI